jgi:hypothetical protein
MAHFLLTEFPVSTSSLSAQIEQCSQSPKMEEFVYQVTTVASILLLLAGLWVF